MINWVGWKSLTKKFEFTQICMNFRELKQVPKLFFKILKLGGHNKLKLNFREK